MQIQIKQAEIITALKDYVAKQGINLTGKSVDITFVAGRKGSGITADVVIDESPIPGFENEEEKPVVKSEGVVGTIGRKVEDAKPEDDAPEQQASSEEASEAKAPTPTLFN